MSSTRFPEPRQDGRPHRILAVDDEAVARTLLTRHLEKAGHEVIPAASFQQARQEVESHGIGSFDCVVTDYQMPEHNGLELLAWVKELDPSLSVIMVTAQGEKDMLRKTLRGGALDYLDKPVAPAELRLAVARGIEVTQQQRDLQENAVAVAEVGDVQEWMVGRHSSRRKGVNLHFHPRHQAGGDFVCHYQLPDGRRLIVVADVSGHDLKAAFVSAYFQGLMQGMIEAGREVASIFEYFNHWLLEGSANQSSTTRLKGLSASLSVCAVLIDEVAGKLTVVNHGAPLPRLTLPSGETRLLGEAGGSPLGWFSDLAESSKTFPLEPGRLHLWTDGLEDHATQLSISPTCLATRLEQDRNEGRKAAWIKQSLDDVLLLSVDLLPTAWQESLAFFPVLGESYKGDQMEEIDRLQRDWQRSLEFALPSLGHGQLFDVLLCSREAVLNALVHGCEGRPDRECLFQIHHQPQCGIVRVRVTDPGPGHHFDYETHSRTAADLLEDQHRGLILIHQMANRVTTKKDGADLTLDFFCPNSTPVDTMI